MKSTSERDTCKRCGVGVDDDHDGDCAACYRLSDEEAEKLKQGKRAA